MEEDGNREAGTVDWAGQKNVCSRPGDSSIATRDSLTKNFGVWGVHAKQPCKKSYSPRPYVQVGENARPTKKNWPRKKRMASWARQRQQGGEHRLTKLGKGFFRDKYYEYLVHVPVIIRGPRWRRSCASA